MPGFGGFPVAPDWSIQPKAAKGPEPMAADNCACGHWFMSHVDGRKCMGGRMAGNQCDCTSFAFGSLPKSRDGGPVNVVEPVKLALSDEAVRKLIMDMERSVTGAFILTEAQLGLVKDAVAKITKPEPQRAPIVFEEEV